MYNNYVQIKSMHHACMRRLLAIATGLNQCTMLAVVKHVPAPRACWTMVLIMASISITQTDISRICIATVYSEYSLLADIDVFDKPADSETKFQSAL
jgi:hypothetical protein